MSITTDRISNFFSLLSPLTATIVGGLGSAAIAYSKGSNSQRIKAVALGALPVTLISTLPQCYFKKKLNTCNQIKISLFSGLSVCLLTLFLAKK